MKRILIYSLIIFAVLSSSAQGIRKEWHEMTYNEKLSLMEAFKFIQSEDGALYKIGTMHGDKFGPIHGNEQFAAWHRMANLKIERDIQEFQPELSIPYWDWTEYDSGSDEMWETQFLGQFDEPGNWFVSLNRSNSGSLPSQSAVDVVMDNTTWVTFRNALNGIHGGPHCWVSGIMCSGESPWDPVFYFHHGTIDKYWQDWTLDGGVTVHTSTLLENSYEGDANYLWDGSVYNTDMEDSRTIGVFYAEDEAVIMEKYTVANDYLSNEVFFYQFGITVENDFVVPNSKKAEIKSMSSIEFLPGVFIDLGATFTAFIDDDSHFDTDCDCDPTVQDPTLRIAMGSTVNPYENLSAGFLEEVSLSVTPTITSGVVAVSYTGAENSVVNVFDQKGILITSYFTSVGDVLDLSNLVSGVYYVEAVIGNETLAQRIIIE